MGRVKRPPKGSHRVHYEWLYGRHTVVEALRAGRRRFHTLLLAIENRPHPLLSEAIRRGEKQGLAVKKVPREQIKALLPGINHQGVALSASLYPYVPLETLLARSEADLPPLFLLLDHLQDTQNVGTLLRAAEIVGCQGVILPKRRSAAVTPAASNASAGAIEHLSIAQVSSLDQAVASLQKVGVWVYALAGASNATSVYDADLRGPVAFIVGSENQGVGALLRRRSDAVLALPMWGRTNSLNAATAGAIALYEARRQQLAGKQIDNQEAAVHTSS